MVCFKVNTIKAGILMLPIAIMLLITVILVSISKVFDWMSDETMAVVKWLVNMTGKEVTQEEYQNAVENSQTQEDER